MKKFPLLSVKAFFLLATSILFASISFAQTPAKCLEIESILVDACVPGGGCTSATSPSCSCEGKNEMVRFKIGPAAINTSDLDITWPNNSFLGISAANATTAGLVAALNATILSCGYLIEPIGGVLPPGRTILLITSTEMCTTANSFANLSDTIYTIFQNAGNFQGHFANYSAVPGLRTTIIKQISTGCADTVVYEKSLLINQLGGYGGSSAINDGSTVEFSWSGVPTYVNNGCQAPFLVITASAGIGGTICQSGTISLIGSESGSYSSIIWQGGQGTFSTPDTLTTNYTGGPTESGTIILTMGVIGFCSDTVFSTVTVNITPMPVASISAGGPTTICAGQTITLTASGGTNYLWNTGSTITSVSVSPTTNTTYSVIVSIGGCSDTTSILVSANPYPTASTSGNTTICSGQTTTLAAFGGINYLWNTGATTSVIFPTLTSSSTYTVLAIDANGCSNSATATITVNPLPTANAGADVTIHYGDATILSASGGINYLWNTGETSTTISASPTATTDYCVYVTDASGCSDSSCVTVYVEADCSILGEPYLPNAFSPNGDGENDSLQIYYGSFFCIKSLSIAIYNRWGEKVFESDKPDFKWDGKYNGAFQNKAVYAYSLTHELLNGKSGTKKGNVSLIR